MSTAIPHPDSSQDRAAEQTVSHGHCQMCLMDGQPHPANLPDPPDSHGDCRLCLMLMDSIPSSVLLLDQQLRIVTANRKFLSRSRLAATAVIGRRLEEVFPPVIYRDMNFRWRVSEVFRSGKAVEGERMVYRAPGLAARTYYYSLVPFRWEMKVRNVVLLMEDVTDMLRLGEDARNAERHLASVIESASDIVLSMDPYGKILTWNTAAEQITAFQEHEVRERKLCELCPESQWQTLMEALNRVRQPGRTERVEVELTSRDGKVIPIAWVFSAMRNAERAVVGLVAVGRDLTERREFETQLRQTEKLAALGVMAGGIAHELRNPLAVVSSASQLLRDRVLTPEVTADCVERIFKGAMRMGGIIENLLSFARPSDKGRKTSLDLVAVIREAVTFMNNQTDANKFTIQLRGPDSPVLVLGNACLLQQLVVNLVQNAANALDDRGGQIEILVEEVDSNITFFVKDTGCGIPVAHMDKIFDPFFTAMPVGKGTGLGLSICHTIAQQHGGRIEVASREGQGTVVKVLLPPLGQGGGGKPIPSSGMPFPRDATCAASGEHPAGAAKTPKTILP